MTTYREPTRQNVDQFDCELYDLILSARTWGEQEPVWNEVWRKLSEVRVLVRDEMHPEDREATRP